MHHFTKLLFCGRPCRRVEIFQSVISFLQQIQEESSVLQTANNIDLDPKGADGEADVAVTRQAE